MLPLLPLLTSGLTFEVTPVVRSDAPTLRRAATFFASAFWAESTTVADMRSRGDASLDARALRSLTTHTLTDMASRYGSGAGERLRSLLVLASDPSRGKIVGCVGVEEALFEPLTGRVLSRAESDALFASEFAAMDEQEESLYVGLASAAALTDALFPEYSVVAVLSNLAVESSERRGGLAQELCAWCAPAGEEWGLPALVLQVDRTNRPARSLYERLGFRELCRDEGATALRLRPQEATAASTLLLVESDRLLQEAPATLITMAKDLTIAPQHPGAGPRSADAPSR